MSDNEKLTAQSDELSVTISVQEVNDTQLETPQDSNPLEKESVKISEKEKEEIKADDVEKENDTQNIEIKNDAEKVHSYKELGTVVAACAMFALSAAVIGCIGMSGRGSEIDTEYTSENVKTTVSTTVTASSNSELDATVSWWKAGVEEFKFVYDDDDDDDEAVTTKVTDAEAEETTTTTTTAEKKTEATTTTTEAVTTKVTTTTQATTTKKQEPEEVEIEEKTFYLTTNVNLRKGAGTSYSKICTLSKNTEVKAFAEVSNGWYKVEANGKTGYIIGDYLTTKKPVTTTVKNDSVKADTNIGNNTVVSYTDEELEMFYWVVEGEVGGCSEASKIAVANVIINRVKSPKFANTLKGVMTAKSQFSAINNYYNRNRKPTQSTIDCVNRALNGEDNTNGAIYFYSVKYCSASSARWFETLTFCFEIDGQRYFKP